jgi:hypothetical protein
VQYTTALGAAILGHQRLKKLGQSAVKSEPGALATGPSAFSDESSLLDR